MHTEKIISIQWIQPEPVYNIAVAVDESYTANGVVVHNCRSRLIPYFGAIPGKRDFKKDFDPDFIKRAEKTSTTFRKSYWSPMVRTKASATYQRSYFTKPDLKTIDKGLTLAIQEERKTKAILTIFPFERLKKMLRYRKIDPDKSIIIDRFGKSLMLDKLEERDIIRSIQSLITQTGDKLAKESLKRKKMVDTAWKDVLATRKGISRMEKDILYYQKKIKSTPSDAAEYMKRIKRNKQIIETAKAQEARQIENWNKIVDMKSSATTDMLIAEKERYQHVLESFNFIKR